jgi:hypothetical protein
MAVSTTEIYRSSNGDRCQLVRMSDPTRLLVLPNPSSSGQSTDTTVADFLSTNGPGPEYAALRRLLSVADEPGSTFPEFTAVVTSEGNIPCRFMNACSLPVMT